jgi:hypothetical protein
VIGTTIFIYFSSHESVYDVNSYIVAHKSLILEPTNVCDANRDTRPTIVLAFPSFYILLEL